MADPMTEQSGVSGVPGSAGQDPAALFRAWLQSQSGQGMTQMGPNMQGGPRQRPMADSSSPQQGARDFSSRGAAQKQSMQNLTSSIKGVMGQITNKISERKNREQQQVFDKFTQAVTGLNQAQDMAAQAKKANDEALKQFQNAKTPDEKQQASQAMKQAAEQMKKAQSAVQQNQQILNDDYNPADPKGQKRMKILEKGFGIDDKNADTPERKQAIQSIQKAKGLGQGPASILASRPQTMQPSTEALQQQMAQKMGVVGKPATGGQILQAGQKAEHEAGIDRRADLKTNIAASLQGMKIVDGKPVPMTEEEMSPLIKSKMASDQVRQQLQTAQAELAQAKTKAVPEQVALAEAKVKNLEGNLIMRQKEFGIRLEEEERKQRETALKGAGESTIKTAVGDIDTSQLTGGRPLQSWAQQTIAQSMPVLDQINGLMQDLEPLKDNNQAGYLAIPRMGYAMGFGSKEGTLAADISNIELQKVIGSARVLKGSSRAYQALQMAMIHLPNAWKDSPKLMYQKLSTVKENLTDTMNDAITYGVKGQREGEVSTKAKAQEKTGKTAPKKQTNLIVVTPEDMQHAAGDQRP